MMQGCVKKECYCSGRKKEFYYIFSGGSSKGDKLFHQLFRSQAQIEISPKTIFICETKHIRKNTQLMCSACNFFS